MTRQNVSLDPKDVGETDTVSFDYSAMLTSGDSIVSASCSCYLFSGSDPAPGAVLTGSSTIAGLVVLQQVTGGIDGNNYTVRCSITSAQGRILVQSCNLPVVQL
jgi:hypothetical protein